MAQHELARPETGWTERNDMRLADADFDDFASNAGLDAFLIANGYTQATCDKLTQNDKVYAVRQLKNANSVK